MRNEKIKVSVQDDGQFLVEMGKCIVGFTNCLSNVQLKLLFIEEITDL